MRFRVAVLGNRNATPVSGSFRAISDCRTYLRQLAEGPDYVGRTLVIKAYTPRGNPVKGFYEDFDSESVRNGSHG